MKKLSIIRFKPKSEHFDEFVASLKHFISLPDRKGITDSFIMTKDEEVFSVVVRYADQLETDAKQGVEFSILLGICFMNIMRLTVTPFH